MRNEKQKKRVAKKWIAALERALNQLDDLTDSVGLDFDSNYGPEFVAIYNSIREVVTKLEVVQERLEAM